MKTFSRKKTLQIMLGTLFALGMYTTPAMAADATTTPGTKKVVVPSKINYKMLNLTPEQIKKINEVRLPTFKKIVKLKAEIKLKQIDLQAALVAPSPNPQKVRNLMNQKLALENAVQKAQLDNFLAFKKVLTPAQLQLLPKAVILR